MSHYFSIELLPSYQKLLSETLPIVHPHVYCHHMTVCFNPTEEQSLILMPTVDQVFELETSHLVQDSKGQALRVIRTRSLLCFNKHPHITVSCANGVKPVYSNELLDKNTDVVSKICHLRLHGRMKYI